MSSTVAAMDQSLDDIITTKKARSRSGPRRGQSNNKAAQPQQQQQQGGRGGRGQQQQQQGQQVQQQQQRQQLQPAVVGDKIIVSNLPDDVDEKAIRVSNGLISLFSLYSSVQSPRL